VLKQLAKMAGIQKSVTSYVARHTFATLLAAKLPIHILKVICSIIRLKLLWCILNLPSKLLHDALDGVVG